MKINICEIYLIAKYIHKYIRTINELHINIVAFRAQYKEKFGCFQKSEIDKLEKDDIMLLVSDKDIEKLGLLLQNKFDLSETVIKEEGVTKLCDCIVKYDKTHPDYYNQELIIALQHLMKLYLELKEMKITTSIYGVLESKEEEVTQQMKLVLDNISAMRATAV